MSARQRADQIEQLRRIDSTCEVIEQRWRRGERPSIEDTLADSRDEDRTALLAELLMLEWSYRGRRGESFDVSDYREAFSSDSAVVEQTWRDWAEWQTVSLIPETEIPPTNESHRPTSPESAITVLPGGYLHLVPIGEGGMGCVYRATDPRLCRTVALKVLRWPGEDLLARFRVEARSLARLAHPHIVQVFALEERDGQPCLVMEYVPGGTLEERLRRGPITVPEAVRLTAILARAVQAAHAAGIVHRDLKPANVLMAPAVEGGAGNVLGGWPKISDFGLARLVDDDGQTGSGQILGTPQYMAPEQALGRVKEIGPAVDVWALGAILYRCLTGVVPFAGNSVLETLDKVRMEEPRPMGEMGVKVPAELEALCLRCLEKNAAKRPTMAELAAELERIAAECVTVEGLSFTERERVRRTERQQGVMARPAPVPTSFAPNPPTQRRRPVAVAGALVMLVLAVGVLIGWRVLFPRADVRSDLDRKPVLAGPKPLRVNLFQVWHWDARGEEAVLKGVMGQRSRGAKFGDQVRIEVEFSEPAYAYLIAYNPDGKEQLLWPCDGDGTGEGGLKPPAVEHLEYPPKRGEAFDLNDEPAGGLQAFAVVASREPLPAFLKWRKMRGEVGWKRFPASKGVWGCDARGISERENGAVTVRGDVNRLKGVPPLMELHGSLRKAGAEVVEVIAFGVRAKEGE